jgi:ribosomal protein S18 acetylase RimI-like enzyme
MPSMDIRPVEPHEYEALGRLTVEAYRPFGILDDTGYDEELADVAGRVEVATVLVAVDDDQKILGGVTYVPPGPDNPLHEHDEVNASAIRMLAVADAARRQGVGRELSVRMIDMARDDGADTVLLYSSIHMTAAHQMYLGLGFARDPDNDWEPEPGIELLSFRLGL